MSSTPEASVSLTVHKVGDKSGVLTWVGVDDDLARCHNE